MAPNQAEGSSTVARVSSTEELKPHLASYLVAAAICFVYFAQLTAVVGSGFLAQSIAALFSGSADVVWLGSIINLLTMTLAPPVSQAADLWGRKWFLVGSTVFGFAGCIVVSRAQSMATVMGGYAVLSVTFGGQSLLFAVISEVLPRKHRPLAQAANNVSAGFGAILGLCMGGALLRNNVLQNYRIYFYVNAGIFAAASIICIALYNPPPRVLQQSLTRSQKLQKLDWIGYAILPPALTLLTVGLSYGNNPYSWRNIHTLAPLLCGITLGIVFIIYEVAFKNDGMLHHSLFKHRNFSIALAAICAEGFIFFSINNYYPFEFGVTQQANLLQVALTFVIVFSVSIVAAIVVGFYSSRKKVVRNPLVVGFVSLLVFLILMATAGPHKSGSTFRGYGAFAGVGFGAILPIILSAAQLSTPPEQIALASGLMVASRGIGGVLSLGINDAIFNAALSKLGANIAAATLPLGLPQSSLATLIGALASGSPAALAQVQGATPQIIAAGAGALLDTYALGFRNVWILAACLSVVTAIWCAFFTDPSAEFNNHIDASAEVAPELKVMPQQETGHFEAGGHEKHSTHTEHTEHTEDVTEV